VLSVIIKVEEVRPQDALFGWIYPKTLMPYFGMRPYNFSTKLEEFTK